MFTISSYNKLLEQNVFKKCVLNQLNNYHILDNYAFDLTHDMWLGVVQVELGLVLNSIIVDKLFTLDFLNGRIKSFNYGSTDFKNRPNLVYLNKQDKSAGIKIKQKAAKTLCLFKLLPFIIG
jgi:hypothetical protein